MLHRLKFFLFLFSFSLLASAQKYPVQITARVVLPFSGYLPDYGLPGSEKLKVVLLLTDFAKGNYDVKLSFSLKGNNGITISTKPTFNPAPIALDAGMPYELTSELLNQYFTFENLDFAGISPAEYQKTQTLPEGYYTFCVTAYAFSIQQPTQVSNSSCSMGWITLSDPPKILFPTCGSSANVTTPQQVIFKWNNMSAGVPGIIGNIEYELSLYEMRSPEHPNPDEIVASLKPIFTTTTDFTTYNYGIADPPLEVGMKYAWRVQAKDKTGRSSIKNNGFSPTCTFTYGSPYGNISLTLTARTISSNAARLRWDSLSPFKSYEVNYRKKGTDFWFENKADSSNLKLINLEKDQDYEARVRGFLDKDAGAWSNIATFKTPVDSAHLCKIPGALIPSENSSPLPAATSPITFKIGHFDILATKISGGNGIFSGVGQVFVPYLGITLNVKYENIFINTDKVVTRGEVVVLSKPIGDWINDHTTGTVKDGKEITDHKVDFPTDKDNISVQDDKIIIKGKDGQTKIIQPYTPGTEVTIEDGSGTIFVIDKNGKATDIGKKGDGQGPISQDKNILNTKYASATFVQHAGQQYGFDKFEYEQLKLYYEQVRDKNKSQPVFVNWKSAPTAKTDFVTATISISNTKEVNPDSIYFITGTGTRYYPVEKTGDNFTLRIVGGKDGDVQELFAAYNNAKKETVCIGKLNVVSYQPQKKEIVLVPLNGASSPDAAAVQQKLNEIYASAITSFNISTATPLSVDASAWDKDGNSRLNVGNKLMSRYSSEMQAINSELREQSYYDKNKYYFIVTTISGDSLNVLQGDMPRGRNIGYVFSPGDGAVTATLIAHEIGHGAFALEHTFTGNTPIEKSSTQNLMDYSSGIVLRKYQWDHVINPVAIIGALEDEEDAAYETDGHYSTVYLVCLMLGMNQSAAEQLAIATEDPDTDVHSEMDFELDQTWAYLGAQQEIHSLTGGFHTVEEMMTAFKFIYISKGDIKGMGELLHRYGDTYAHTRLDNLLPADLKNYTFDSLKLKAYVVKWKDQKSPPIMDRIAPWIQFLNYQLSIHGYKFLTNEKLQKKALYGMNLVKYLHSIYYNQPADKFVMYGRDGATGDHALSDGGAPDFIYVRPQWYLTYVKNLYTLLNYKFNNLTGDLDINVFNKMVEFASSNKCSLKGIIDYEIAKKLGKKTFYIPVFYSTQSRAVAYMEAVFLTNYLQVAKNAVKKTKEYLLQQGITVDVQEINGPLKRTKEGVFTTLAYKITLKP